MTAPSKSSPKIGEDALVHWLGRQLSKNGQNLIGDDTAVLPETDQWAVTVDTQIEGVHFQPGLDPIHVARRLLAVNLSNLAAAGAEPAFAFLVLAAPQGFDHRQFFRALLGECKSSGLTLAGGDLAKASQLTTSLTLLGRRPEGGRFSGRSGAEPGHRLWVGGTVGESALGFRCLERGAHFEGRRLVLPEMGLSTRLERVARRAIRRHLLPRPQNRLGLWLGRSGVGGVLDISDGLARDLHRLCRASGVGAHIELAKVPVVSRFRRCCRALSLDWKDLVLSGGEDYVLLFTLPEGLVPPEEFGCSPIGRIREEGRVTVEIEGRVRGLEALGWDHLEELNQGRMS